MLKTDLTRCPKINLDVGSKASPAGWIYKSEGKQAILEKCFSSLHKLYPPKLDQDLFASEGRSD